MTIKKRILFLFFCRLFRKKKDYSMLIFPSVFFYVTYSTRPKLLLFCSFNHVFLISQASGLRNVFTKLKPYFQFFITYVCLNSFLFFKEILFRSNLVLLVRSELVNPNKTHRLSLNQHIPNKSFKKKKSYKNC